MSNYFFIDSEGRRMVEKLALDFYNTALPFFGIAWKLVLNGYESAVPNHLHTQMAHFLSNHLSSFVTCSLYEALNHGDISVENEKALPWISLFASEP